MKVLRLDRQIDVGRRNGRTDAIPIIPSPLCGTRFIENHNDVEFYLLPATTRLENIM